MTVKNKKSSPIAAIIMGSKSDWATMKLASETLDEFGVPHAPTRRETLVWSAVWISLALLFCGFIYSQFGVYKAKEFLTGYLIELSLSIDNLFVFLLIFSYFKVPKKYQHRVLFWGIFMLALTAAPSS